MGAQLRVFRRRIRSVQATKKITRAMELIASSRIIKAQNQVLASTPYATALYKAVSLAASNARGNHPLLLNKKDGKRSAVLIITADRGLAGAYSANILREGERITELLKDEQGKEVVPFVVGRKGLGYYKFRNREVAASWTGITDRPTYDDAREIAKALLEIFLKPEEQGGVHEIQVIYTRFVNRISQVPVVQRIVPLEVVEELVQSSPKMTEVDTHKPTLPLYDFEPSPEAVLDQLLPKYIEYLVGMADKLEGQYIVIDKQVYAECRFDINYNNNGVFQTTSLNTTQSFDIVNVLNNNEVIISSPVTYKEIKDCILVSPSYCNCS